MGKINESYSNQFFFIGNDENFTSDEKSPAILQNGGEPGELPFNSNLYLKNFFSDRGNYMRTFLTAKEDSTNENSGVGGTSRVTANSTPEQLLKDPRVRAMLDVLGYAEGTGSNYGRIVFGTVLGPSDRSAPYNSSLVGKRNVVVHDFRHHPNLAVHWANGQPPSSAAGRYQFLYSTYKGLNMPDFSPHSQDIAAIKLMQRRGMIEPLLRGDFAAAIHKGAPEWASLPIVGGGSYYGGQGARSLSSLRGVYGKSLKRYEGTTLNAPANPQPKPSAATLKRGNQGKSVENLQDKFIRLGLMTDAQKKTGAGIFGPRTEAAVKKFQKDVGIEPGGKYDAATKSAMDKILSADIKKGARGKIVAQLQDDLVKLGYLTRAAVNTGRGIFGPKTDAALRRFQSEHDLIADGVFGAQTFRAIHSAAPRANGNNGAPPVSGGKAREYKRWNVYSTGNSAARLADGYEDLQPHHDYQSVNYVMRGLTLTHRLEARDVVLTRSGQSNFGQIVPSPITGKVLFAGNEGDGYGNKVVVKNERTGQIVMLGHLQSVGVSRGQTISYGQKLGEQGSTGNSTGAHVHINADPSVIKRWVADLADGKFDGVRQRFDVGRRP